MEKNALNVKLQKILVIFPLINGYTTKEIISIVKKTQMAGLTEKTQNCIIRLTT